MRRIEHQHVRGSWVTVRLTVPPISLRTVLHVQTDLQLDPAHPDHDAVAYQSLIETVHQHLEGRKDIDAADIEQVPVE